ncbi:ZIP family metal transporter [Patescibacteria group bacterium]|nr:ZIP family metal transporter [Patescibacteria group bacterium]
MDWFTKISPIFQVLIATLYTWGLTALGAGLVFFFKQINRKVLDGMLGLAAGIMIAASFWSLLAPAIELAGETTAQPWIPVTIGFLLGALFLWGLNKLIPHLHLWLPVSKAEGPKTSWHRSILLVLAITIHNVPEGLAIGIAFGAVAVGIPSATLGGAIALAIGIGIQNFPEGTAVSVPLRREGLSRAKSFWYGQLSGIVEPISGLIGFFAIIFMRPILPYALAFAAGAMIFVVVEELIPESQYAKNTDLATLGAIFGFALMMALDVSLG